MGDKLPNGVYNSYEALFDSYDDIKGPSPTINDSSSHLIGDDDPMLSPYGSTLEYHDCPSNNIAEEETFNIVKPEPIKASPSTDSLPKPPSLGMSLAKEQSDKTKSVLCDSSSTNSFLVKKDALLCIEFDKKIGNDIAKVEFWTTFKNDACGLPVECMDPGLRSADDSPSALSVFQLTSGGQNKLAIDYFRDQDGIIMAKVEPFAETNIYVKFKAVSSEVKQGRGWYFHSRMLDRFGNVIAQDTIEVKSLKIIRSGGEPNVKNLKRKREPSFNESMMMTPSPSTSSEFSSSSSSENDDDFSDLPSMTPEEVQAMHLKNQLKIFEFMQQIEKRMKRNEQLNKELARRANENHVQVITN